MQFDQTERGNREFDLPKNSLPCDIVNDNVSVAYYRTLELNPWKQMQRPGVHTWSNTIRSLLPQQEQRLVKDSHEPSVRNKATTSFTARTKN